ncbi:hypothetical protein ACFQ3S_01265 [Mucilaginibacter terrae]|uniref:hypothetical protein n=1 Tax=Mucilaginibacter terrae TaxID=1955052 RepID=UPI00364388F4
MTDKSKKIFFALTVILPIAFYCVYYYGMMIKNAPYRFSDLQYIRFEYGLGDSLINKYDSRTSAYQYVTRSGKLKKLTMRITNEDKLYLHRKASDLGFWNFPAVEEGDTYQGKKLKSPRYLIEFAYKNKVKKVLFDQAYNGDVNLKDANLRLIKEIQTILDEREKHLEN